MLSVIVCWIYILITTFGLGYAVSALSGRFFHYTFKGIGSILVAGLIIATVYAEFFSLFDGVGWTANVVLIVVTFVIFLIFSKRIISDIRQKWYQTAVWKKIAIGVLFVMWAYFTSRGYMHYDSDLYHAQSIRWIEEFGVVKGLGNLHTRFAYNSSSFPLSALYSLKFIGGISLHTTSGFIAFILSLSTLDLSVAFRRKKMLLSDYAMIAAVYYLTTIYDEVVAPASDYFIMCLIFYIVITWLKCLEDDSIKSTVIPYAWLCVVGVYALTTKLTAGLILILVIKPAYRMVKDKKGKEIVAFLLMGLAVAIPWFIRTFIISGWLIYPFPALDLFDVDWKIPRQVVETDANDIRLWARSLYDISRINTPLTGWFPDWFKTELSLTEKLLIIGDMLAIVVAIITGACNLIRRKWTNPDAWLVIFTVLCSYTFWQLSAPMIRYGYAYVLLSVVLILGYFVMRIGKDKLLAVAIILYGVYKAIGMGVYIKTTCMEPYYVTQQPYGIYETYNYDLSGITIYLPAEGDQVGYDPFPAAVYYSDTLRLRGNEIREGFAYR